MKTLKRTLLVLLSTVLAFAIALIGFTFWAYYNPEKAYQLAEKYLFPKDLKVSWEEFNFTGVSLENWNFQIDLEILGLKVEKTTPDLNIPIDLISIKADLFSLVGKANLHRFHIQSDKQIRIKIPPANPSDPELNLHQTAEKMVGYLKFFKNRIEIQDLKLNLQRISFFSENKKEPIEISLSSEMTSKDLVWDTNILIPGKSPLKVDASGVLNLEKWNITSKFTVNGFGIASNQEMNIDLGSDLLKLNLVGPVKYNANDMNLNVTSAVDIQLSKSELSLNGRISVNGISKTLKKLENFNVRLNVPLEEDLFWSKKASNFTIDGPVELFFLDARAKTAVEKSCECALPGSLKTESTGKIWFSILSSTTKQKQKAAEIFFSLESLKNKLFSVDLKLAMDIEKEGDTLLYSPSVDGQILISSFKGITPLLDSYDLMVPAPFDILDGTLSLVAKGPIGEHFPAKFIVDLKSKTQVVNIETEAKLNLSKDFKEAKASVLAKINSLIVELPPLDPVRGLPRISPDSRIQMKPPKSAKKVSSFKFSVDLEVETAQPGAIKLLSKYFKPHLPITLNIKSQTRESNTGYLKLEPFEVTYLRRTVKVERLRVDLRGKNPDVMPLKGRFRIKQTDYTVFIDLGGTTKNPTVSMSSDPYLPESEIVSVLLYDRTSDELVSADAETAGSVQAAVADRAIGLFGLWAFASTPIKSFSYNPATKVYSATVAISDSVTAGVGTNWESGAQLELRRRVSDKWVITAMWTPATENEAQTTKLVLQWENRY